MHKTASRNMQRRGGTFNVRFKPSKSRQRRFPKKIKLELPEPKLKRSARPREEVLAVQLSRRGRGEKKEKIKWLSS